MAEFDSEEKGYQLNHTYQLHVETKYENQLDVEGFSLMMKNPSYCYKFYWLEAIVCLISEGVRETTFNELIGEMIANAWYSVLEYHIHLSGLIGGEIKDGLERAVLFLQEISGLPANASKVEIKNAICEHEKELKKYKEQLTNMVPYRALAGFFDSVGEKADWDSKEKAFEYKCVKYFCDNADAADYS